MKLVEHLKTVQQREADIEQRSLENSREVRVVGGAVVEANPCLQGSCQATQRHISVSRLAHHTLYRFGTLHPFVSRNRYLE